MSEWLDKLVASMKGWGQPNTTNNSPSVFQPIAGATDNSLNSMAFNTMYQAPSYASGMPANQGFNLPGAVSPMAALGGLVPDGGGDTSYTGNGLFTALFGGKNTKTGFQTSGMISPIASLLGSGAQAWLGGKQVGLAEDTLDFQKDAFSRQFNNQATLTNASLRDRQAVRYARDPNRYQSPDEYMKQNKVG